TPGAPTVAAGTISQSFSVSDGGSATLVLPLTVVPGRAGVEPSLSLTYSSDAASSDGILGAGFALGGITAITRCGSTLARDGEIRAVRFDAGDNVCLSGQRLIRVASTPGLVEFRTFPDSFTKVVGHYASEEDKPGNAVSFEVFLSSGLVIDAGTSAASKPLAPGGVARAWLAERAHDGRGNAMTYDYCFADDPTGYTAEYALDEILYTSFEGSPALPPSRAVKLVYGTKDTADQRTLYAGGMALQSALRLDEIQMLGPEDALVRRYAFTYDLGPTTKRTLLTQVAECAADSVCKPPTRFQFSSTAPGFEKVKTTIAAPVSRRASPMLMDIDGDGLDDLVSPDSDPALSTAHNPITRWLVAHNRGPNKSAPYLSDSALAFSEEWPTVAQPTVPDDPALLQPEIGTSLDYNQDHRTDILLHDVYDTKQTWQVLLAQPDGTFAIHDTGIPRPFPLGASPTLPNLTTAGGSMHLADLDGDGIADLIQCEDHSKDNVEDPSAPAWIVHRWKPEQDTTPAGFALEGEALDNLAGFRCDTELYTVDVDADGKVDLLVGNGGPEQAPASTYLALSRLHDGRFRVTDTALPLLPLGGRLLFLDINGDGLPDAMQSGFGDQNLRVYVNTGKGFSAFPLDALRGTGTFGQDTYFHLAVPIDYDNDGRQDLLMPMPDAAIENGSAVPAWVVLLSSGGTGETAFHVVDPGVPFEAALDAAITLADPHGARVGDLDGDGAQDVLLPIGGSFTVFHNLAADQDLLVAITDGMNAHDPGDPGFVPNVALSYAHLTDRSITEGIAAGDPALGEHTYLARADEKNGCAYPRTCAVGSHRVVSAYATNNGADGVRRFALRYRDGRYDRLGNGFLGFGERLVTDLDTGAGVADFYDNQTFDADLRAYPFVGQVAHEWRWYPGLPDQPEPDKIELSFTDFKHTVVPTSEHVTYFTLPTHRRVRRAQGVVSSNVEAYVRKVEAGAGATLLRDLAVDVSDFDLFGHILTEDVKIDGLDLTFHVERNFKNDTESWVLGQLQTQKECSTAAMVAQCRTLTRTTTIYGEAKSETIDSDDGLPDTKLSTVYGRDAFGNVESITEDDAFEHHRVSSTTYEPAGIYPLQHTNAAGHVSITRFDAGLGVLVEQTDPNLLVTSWAYDGFGRLGKETRPDNTTTTVTISRSKDGGAQQKPWRVVQRTTSTGGADDTVELDGKSRPVRAFWHGPEPHDASGAIARLMQVIDYDDLGEHVARRSVPVREDAPESALLFDAYRYDGLGREIEHTTPWGLQVSTSYEGAAVQVSDALGNLTTAEQDALGRPMKVIDAAHGTTAYTYGPFGLAQTITAPGNAVTVTTLDALGRIKQLDDPDRGTTITTHDGFGELISSTDALNRVTSSEYDTLGRPLSRVDVLDGKQRVTTWTWDTAGHGLGKLHKLASPDGQKVYSYNALGKLETMGLAIEGEPDVFTGRLDYDAAGRVSAITYPTPAGAAPFVIAQDYDAHGYIITARDSATSFPYWQLADVDDAGRFKREVLGKIVTTERSWFAAKQSLESIVTTHGAATIQQLSYGYDDHRNLASRTDALQMQHPTERFRYDTLDRVTCAYFSQSQNDAAPCALGYGYDSSGNLTFKSDLGALSYDDPGHPHAVTSAGGESFGYDAVGNQIARPGGTIVTYTAFDLPAKLTQGVKSFSFGYDGDEKRIRKTTPEEETLYFQDLYERVTSASAPVAHRYYVRSPERVIAIVTRGGAEPGTRYLHADNLGSTDAVTDEGGNVLEHRSYDPFGQRRNPIWGAPPPAIFSELTTQGFTGHESDGELGLVNMKGRIYDPKIGRFLTMDPLVQAPLAGQSWNPYSYVFNNPLSYVDPSGFEGEEPKARTGHVTVINHPDGHDEVIIDGRKPPKADPKESGEQVGAFVPPVDVSTLGSSSGFVAQPANAAPEDWTQQPIVQVQYGLVGGFVLGLVPFGGVGQQLLDAFGVLPHGTPELQLGLAFGQIIGGALSTLGGFAGEVGGGLASATGVGAVVGVPVIVVSSTVVAGGIGNIAAGIRGLSILATTGSESGPPPGPKAGQVGGDGAGKGFPSKVKDQARAESGNTCVFCGKKTTNKPGPGKSEIDHAIPKVRGGNNTPENAQNTCRTCNRSKGTSTSEEFVR
ncbi:MAG: FG-GAP-like repeat-containing protein, partial [Minicystis sp.]